jgi:homogentisate 1,2-dioxygenase
MKRYIPIQVARGDASRQAHTGLPEGTFEREMSKEGFFGPAAHFYHKRPPTGWCDWEGPLRPRAFDLARLNNTEGSPWDAPVVLHNSHVSIRFWRMPMLMDHLVRNSDGDDLIFVHEGQGNLFCDFGHLAFEAGDYIVIPRGTMWRLECSKVTTALLVEATNSTYTLPDKGIVGNHAIFDPALLDAPEIDDAFAAQRDEDASWHVAVKRSGEVSKIFYPHNPLDVIGWKGDLSVVRINVKDIRPLSSHRYHLPPSAHTTFVGGRHVVCTFAPRPFETDADALKIPFFHNNDDYDEVLFYHRGEFFSRPGINSGTITFHPAGFTHGPSPTALKNMLVQPKSETDEYAVMIDTRDALQVGGLPSGVEDLDYVKSWAEGESD